MKKIFLLLCWFFISSCSDSEQSTTSASENEVDAARNFIRSALDGNYKEASKYMLQDSTNIQLLQTFEDNYQQHMSREDKRYYREASIRFPEVRKVNDSASVVVYSNSYKNHEDSLLVVATGGTWLVDFKYSFTIRDSLP